MAIPDAGGMIHGCLVQGRLRLIDPEAGEACANNEQPVSWHVGGIPGPPGPAGPPGPPGPEGSQGVSIAYWAYRRDGVAVSAAPEVTTIASLMLPGDNYIITGCANITARTSAPQRLVNVHLTGGIGGIDTSASVWVSGENPGHSVALQKALWTPAYQTYTVRLIAQSSQDHGGTIFAEGGLTAIRVGSVVPFYVPVRPRPLEELDEIGPISE